LKHLTPARRGTDQRETLPHFRAQRFSFLSSAAVKGKLADKIKLTHLARVETKEAGNHEMSDRQTNAMQDADFIPWKKWQGFDR
jgi:hypothetical protein